MISTELYARMSQGTNATVFYWLAFASSQPVGILAHMKKYPCESHGNGNPIPMHISSIQSRGQDWSKWLRLRIVQVAKTLARNGLIETVPVG